MTYAEKILALLQSTSQRLCDDCLAVKLQMKSRQQAYIRCSQLAATGEIRRGSSQPCSACGKTKITSQIASSRSVAPAPRRDVKPVPSKPWFWEGHVQNTVVAWLQGNQWTIQESANTAAKTPGKDIIAIKDHRTLWVTVKGYPEGTAKTNAPTQARHWFSHAMFDLLCYRNESASVELAVALPDRGVTYRNLSRRCAWALRTLPASILWIAERGTVRLENWR